MYAHNQCVLYYVRLNGNNRFSYFSQWGYNQPPTINTEGKGSRQQLNPFSYQLLLFKKNRKRQEIR